MRKWYLLTFIAVSFFAFVVFSAIHTQKLESDTYASMPLQNHLGQFVIDPYPTIALQPSQFSIQFNESSLHASKAYVQLEMKNMLCGVVTFDLKKQLDGSYKGEGIPLMKGHWVATAIFESDEGAAEANMQSEKLIVSRPFEVK